MTDQKFYEGDRVFVREFDDIDTEDIGVIRKDRDSCYSLDRNDIKRAVDYGELEVTKCVADLGTYVYRLRIPGHAGGISYYWAQGMLRPAYGEELAEEDPDGLFEILFGA